jgi:hypothetical protein
MFGPIKCREAAAEPRPAGGSVGRFGTAAALDLNAARLAHLAALDLPMDGGTVLEVGAGVGRLAGFFIGRGCSVVVTKARAETVAEGSRRGSSRHWPTDPNSRAGR